MPTLRPSWYPSSAIATDAPRRLQVIVANTNILSSSSSLLSSFLSSSSSSVIVTPPYRTSQHHRHLPHHHRGVGVVDRLLLPKSYRPTCHRNRHFRATMRAPLPSYDGRNLSSSTTTSAIIGDENEDTIQRPRRRLSAAIVGSGPSGFYAAKYLMSSISKRILQSEDSPPETEEVMAKEEEGESGTVTKPIPPFGWSGIDVDVLERLPTPYGLVRYGVAPDHPEVKNVEREFASLFNENCEDNENYDVSDDAEGRRHRRKRASHTSLSYFGNVDVGKDVSLAELRSLYDVVILAYGCQSSDLRLGVPGSGAGELEGVLSAREFVAWYNGHPEYGHVGDIVDRCLWRRRGSMSCTTTRPVCDVEFDNDDDDDRSDGASSPPPGGEEISPARVVVIGQGNVALDIARILVKGGTGLVETDVPNTVLGVLRGGVSHVSVVGRRGHVQGAFTIKELRELTKLKDEGHDASFVVRKEELELGMTDSSISELKGPSGRPKTRIDKLLRESASSDDDASSDAAKRVELRFLMKPIRLESSDSDGGRIGRVVFERASLVGDPFDQKIVGTSVTESMPADLVLVSIGYRGMPLEGMDDDGLFDDTRGVVANVNGKVVGENNLFVTGWIKRGPTGIIGTNISDAKETVASVMEYIESGGVVGPRDDERRQREASSVGRVGLVQILHGRTTYISWSQYLTIDATETDHDRLRNNAQPREKLLTVDDMLAMATRKIN
ncbi:hypothetical protein ACHAXA_010656 [Cyclostephanos tholiformis]|uniref:Adrenodoxin-NADP(+) reductase n=1 Tax=Cyclostephanos tholiformis TaxID=382380 RepID=A0ABD3RUF4_9STRA